MSNPEAAIIIIGDEILSGRTLDLNTQQIALTLRKKNIIVAETRTIPDKKTVIAKHVKELSDHYDYVFTTGGIGPTHDDITAEAVALAFQLPYIKNTEISQIIKTHYPEDDQVIKQAREKMAYIPAGATLLFNQETNIPGFVTQNVFSLAGIPSIMMAMLESALVNLETGDQLYSKTLKVMLAESHIAKGLSDLQQKYPTVTIGSYPFHLDKQIGTNLVLTSTELVLLEKAYQELAKLCTKIKKYVAQ